MPELMRHELGHTLDASLGLSAAHADRFPTYDGPVGLSAHASVSAGSLHPV